MTAKKVVSVSLAAFFLLGLLGVYLVWTSGGEQVKDAGLPGHTALLRGPRELSASRATDGSRGNLPERVSEAEDALPGDSSLQIFGRITDRSGKAVPGARVIALPHEKWSGVMRDVDREAPPFQKDYSRELGRVREAYLRLAEGVPRTTSDERGVYRFQGMTERQYRIVVEHADYLPQADSVVAVKDREPTRCDIELDPGYAISGIAIDSSGRPVEGASVTAESMARGALRGTEKVRELLAAWEQGWLVLDQGKAATGPDGAFRLNSLEPSYHVVVASRQEHLDANLSGVPAGTRDVTLTLAKGALLEGRILDPSATPAVHANVKLVLRRSAEVHRFFDTTQQELGGLEGKEASSGEDGRFRMAGVGEGTYDLFLRVGAFPVLSKEIVIRGAHLDLGDLVLEASHAIAGVVLGTGNAPVTGARVWIERPYSKASPFAYLLDPEGVEALAEANTEADGRFLLGGLPAGVFKVKAAAEGLSPGSIENVRAGSETVTISLGKGFTVRGNVVDREDSHPVPGVELKIGLRGELRAVSDANGAFEIPNVPPSTMKESTCIQAYHPGYGTYLETRVSLLGRDEKSPIVIRLPRSGLLRGWVRDSKGIPVGGARVWLEVGGAPGPDLDFRVVEGSRALTAEDGSFSVQAPAGHHFLNGASLFVVASHRDHRIGRGGLLAFPSTHEKWPEVTVVLKDGATVMGTVTNFEGQPVPGARVRIRRIFSSQNMDMEGTSRRPAPDPEDLCGTIPSGYSASPEGAFRILGVEEGLSEISVTAIGYALLRGMIEVQGENVERHIVLETGGAIEGRVVDSNRNPLVGAEVVAHILGEAQAPGAQNSSEFQERMSLSGRPGVSRAQTDGQGRFRLENLPRDAIAIVARAEAYEPAKVFPVRPGDQLKDLILHRFSAIMGTVRAKDSGDAITTFAVDVLDRKKLESHGLGSYQGASEGRLEFRDPAGRFVYDGLRLGEYALLITAPGFLFKLDWLSLGGGEERSVEALLDRGGRIEGIVLDEESGEPVAGARIFCADLTEQVRMHPPGQGSTQSGEDGTFSLWGLEEGAYSVYADHPLYKPENAPLMEVPVGRESPRIEFKLIPAGRVEGRLKGFSSSKMTCRVILKEPPGTEWPTGEDSHVMSFVEPDGHYCLNGVEPGSYVLELRKQPIALRPVEYLGPTGFSQSHDAVGPEEATVMGAVTVERGRTAVFDFDVP